MATQTNTFDQRGLLLLDYVTPGTTGKSHELFKQLTRAPLIRTADDPTLFKMFPGNCWASHAGRRLLSVSSIPVAFEEPSLVAWQDTLSAAQQATPLHVSTGQESTAPSNVRESKLAKTTGATSMRQQHRRQAQDAEEETASSSSSSSPAPSSAAAVAAHRMPTFVPGDLVWVQERGYPYWPALVALVARAGGRLKVEFFGEETNADVSLSRVLPFRNAQFGKLCSGKDVAPLQQTAFRSGLRDAVQYEKEQQVAKALRRAQPSVPLRGVVGAKPTVDYPTFDAAAAWQLAVGGLIWFRHATNGVMWPGIVAAIASPVAAAAATPQVAQHDMASNALSAPPATLAAPTTSAPAAAASDSQQRTASGPSVVGFDTEELVVTVQALGDDELFHLTDAALPWLCAFRDAHHFHAYHGAGAGNRRDVATSFARAMNQAFCYEAHQKATVAAPIASGSTADTQVFGDRSFEAIGGDGGPMDDSGAQDARSTTSSSQHQDASSSDSSSAHTPVSEPASAESAALSVTVSIAASSSAPASTSPAAVKASTVVRTSCSTAADISVTTAVTSSSNERPRGMHRQEQRVVVDTTLTFRAAGAKMVPLNPSLPRQARRV